MSPMPLDTSALEDRVRHALDGAATRIPVGSPPPVEAIEAASHRRARRAARQRWVGGVAMVLVVAMVVVAVRGREGDTLDTAAVPAGPVRHLGLAYPGAEVEWAADDRGVHDPQAAGRPGMDVGWLGLSVAGDAPGVRYRLDPSDPTSSWFSINALSGPQTWNMPSPLPQPESGTIPIRDGVGWFDDRGVIDVERFTWRLGDGSQYFLHGVGLSREAIVRVASSVAPDGGDPVPSYVPGGYQRTDRPDRDPAPTHFPPSNVPTPTGKIQYTLPGFRGADVTTVPGGAAVLDEIAYQHLLQTDRVDIATVRGHRALITSPDPLGDFWVIWHEPENGFVVIVHVHAGLQDLPDILRSVSPVDDAAWEAAIRDHGARTGG